MGRTVLLEPCRVTWPHPDGVLAEVKLKDTISVGPEAARLLSHARYMWTPSTGQRMTRGSGKGW